MSEDTVPQTEKQHNHHLFLAVYIVLIGIVGAAIGWYAFHSQHTKIAPLIQQNSSLHQNLKTLNTQVVNAKVASVVTTTGWKTYCDPHGSFCFKYPESWKVVENYDALHQIGSATITNPGKSLSITYQDGDIKDGFAANFILASASALQVGSNSLGVFGGYYVSSVEHTPFYAVMNVGNGTDAPSLSSKPGQNIYVSSPAAFLYRGGAANSAIGMFTVQPTNTQFLTTQQSDAWFNSVDGKTAHLIASSLYSKSM